MEDAGNPGSFIKTEMVHGQKDHSEACILKSLDDHYILPLRLVKFSGLISKFFDSSEALNNEFLKSIYNVSFPQVSANITDMPVLDLSIFRSDLVEIMIQYLHYKDAYLDHVIGEKFVVSTADQAVNSRRSIPQFSIDPAIVMDLILLADFLEV